MGNIKHDYEHSQDKDYANLQLAYRVDEHQHAIRILSLLVSLLIGITLAKEWVPQNTFWADLLVGVLIGLAVYWAVWYFTEGS